ncbi:hypothetical protein DY000_02010478 [Brassica cretica]|uniref:DUF632 domain-containing protein n=1 Tax=Brassica cretica TaxID=69181 RepID=A0ABQ7C6D1_BRACR|nr:hypothetical protein DY000_02010478 [Brassica cretica]
MVMATSFFKLDSQESGTDEEMMTMSKVAFQSQGILAYHKSIKNFQASSSIVNVVDKVDNVDETCTQENETSPEIATEVKRSDDELHDEAYESSCSVHTHLMNVVENINSISKKAASSSEVYELLEVWVTQGNLSVSLSITFKKLHVWEKKLEAEVTAEERLRVLYEKGYIYLKSLDTNGAESNEIYEEKSEVNEVINVFKEMWRFLAKCHHKQFQEITRSKPCAYMVEK